jgi:hypothetical protein
MDASSSSNTKTGDTQETKSLQNDVKKLSYCDPTFMSFFGLTKDNILDYFYNSPFYDPKCCNQALRGQDASLDHLKTMTGIQYLRFPNPHEPKLFVVKKVMRTSPTHLSVLDIYYCIEGTVYQSPDLFDLIKTRSSKLNLYVRESFDSVLAAADYSAERSHECFQAPEVDTNGSQLLDFREFPTVAPLVNDINAICDYVKQKREGKEKDIKVKAATESKECG